MYIFVIMEAHANDDLFKPSTVNDVAMSLKKPNTRGRPFVHYFNAIFNTLIPRGGVLSNSFNLASASLGAGIITLPWAFRASGIIMATLYLIFMTIFTVYTVTIMGFVMEKTGLRAFEQMSRGVLGRGYDYFMAIIMGTSCFGTAIAYVIAAESLITPVLENSKLTPEFLKTLWGVRLMVCVVWLVGMFPLVIPKKLNTLRYFSAASVTFVVFFVVIIVYHSCKNGLPKKSETQLVVTGNIGMEGLGVFVFAYLCHAVAYQAYFEMKKRSTTRLALSATFGMTACSILYWLAGFFGYMEFGQSIDESVLSMFDPLSEPIIMLAYFGVIIKICTSYALNMIPCRNTIYYIIGWDINTLPYWKHIGTMTFISLIVLICGIFIPRISTAFNFAGAVCGGFIGFIYPALFYMYSGGWSLEKVGLFHYIMTYLSLIIGVVSVVFGTGATIYSFFA